MFASLLLNGVNTIAGTGDGAFFSSNNGQIWTLLQVGKHSCIVVCNRAVAIFLQVLIAESGSYHYLSLGINEINNNSSNISICPNPAIDKLNIDAGNSGFTNLDLRIYDAMGDLVLEKNI